MKRAMAALLALVLALGAVVPTWAEETEEESTAPQATGETYDAGEDTAAPMMMLAARGAAATAASTRAAAITKRLEQYRGERLQGVRRGKVKENKKILERLDVCVQPFLFFCPGAGPKRKGDM